MSTEITINIKCVNADKATVTIENSVSVLNLKEKIAEILSVPASQQRLIYKGKVMKDELTLDHYGIQHEHTVHMVKGAAPASASSSSSSSSAVPLASPSSTPTTSSTTSPTPAGSFPGAASSNPFAAFGGLGGAAMGGAPGTDFNRMQEQLMRSPDMMQQIMNSPMMDNILNNPDMLRNMFLNNPQMQTMLDANPQIRHVLNDPAVLRQSMEMMRNPNAMREAMRGQDLAMSQIENLPGGFNALRRMFEEVQQPMMEAASSSGTTMSSPPGNANNAGGENAAAATNNSTTPSSTAMPNPWGGSANPSGAANPYAALGGLGDMGAFGANPFQNSGLGMGGMGMGMQQDPAQMAQMMANPMMQQMMAQMMADPAMLDQMAAANPQLRTAVQNPQIRAMLGNPEFMRQMLNPTNMQAMNQLQQSMQTLQQNGMFGAGGTPFGGFGANNSNNAFGGLNFDSLLAPNGGMPNTNTTNPMFGASMPQTVVPPVDPVVRYAAQLQQLQDMGFADQAANVRALQSSGGNVNAAVERLLGGN